MKKVTKYVADVPSSVEVAFDDECECLEYERKFKPFYELRDKIDDAKDKFRTNDDENYYLKKAYGFLEEFCNLFDEVFFEKIKFSEKSESDKQRFRNNFFTELGTEIDWFIDEWTQNEVDYICEKYIVLDEIRNGLYELRDKDNEW